MRQFSTVVLDEAQSVKNPFTDLSQTITWLEADFHVFLTATPLLAGAKDCLGNWIHPPEVSEISKEGLTCSES